MRTEPMGIELQVALDFGNFEEVVALAERLERLVDRVEIGTPLVLRYGVELVRVVKDTCPNCCIVADFKIADAGEHEARIGFDRGADVVTVLAAADDQTVAGCVRAARDTGKRVLADLMGQADVVGRAEALRSLGVDEVCLHTATDTRPSGAEPLAPLQKLRERVDVSIAVAGGIGVDALPALLACGPDIIIVGSAITKDADPAGAAAELLKLIREA